MYHYKEKLSFPPNIKTDGDLLCGDEQTEKTKVTNMISTTTCRECLSIYYNKNMSNKKPSDLLYYFDQHHRVYEINGVKKSSPYYEGYFRPIKIVSENDKEMLSDYGIIKKKTMQYHYGRQKYKVFTQQQKDDEVYVQENRNTIAEKVRALSAEKLRLVEAILNKDCNL